MTPTASEKPQTDTLHGPNLILDVENFGPIAEAKTIEFKPMTVFVGPSNTGKTYLAMVLHAFLKTATSLKNTSASGTQTFSIRSPEQLAELHSLFIQDASTFFRSIGKKDDTIPEPFDRRWSEATLEELQIAADDAVSDTTLREFQIAANDAVAQFSTEVKRLLTQFFEVDDLDQMRHSSNTDNLVSPSIVLSVSGEARMRVSLWGNVNRIDLNHADIQIPEYLNSLLEHAKNTTNHDDPVQASQSSITSQMSKAVHRILSNFPYSVYLPTGRTGIMNAHRILTSHIIESATRYGIEERKTSTYHLLARDFLRLLIELREQPTRRQYSNRQDNMYNIQDLYEVADIIEQSIVSGHIRVRETLGLADFEYEHQGVVTPMFRASSMVTEFAPIVMFLRNHIGPNDMLIIDEPESHLHPAAQQRMAAALAFIVRSGVRILITTHSHYMVEQISDFVAASNLSPEKRRELLRLGRVLEDQDIYLNEDEVGVYSFDNSTGSTFVKNIPFDENFAYAPPDHLQALTEQFNRNVGIMRAQRNGHSVNGHNGT